MANAEMQLISRIVRLGDIVSVIDWGITEFDFRTMEAKSLFRYIAGYYLEQKTKGSVIGPRAFADVFPQVPLFDDPSMTTDALCVEVRRTRAIQEAKEYLMEAIDSIEVEPLRVVSILQSQMGKLIALGDTRNPDLTFQQAMERIQVEYEMKKLNKFALAKMTWPWDLLNDLTGGITKEDYIVFYGRPKSMKTWVIVILLAWAFTQEKRICFYTKEMTSQQLFGRIAACICKIPYQEFRNGRLHPEDEQMLAHLVAHLRDKYSRADLICLDGRQAGAGGDTVAWLQSKVEKYKPDILFVDGMYLLSDMGGGKKTADWQRVTNISRDLRSLVLSTGVPVIATMQANRAAAKHSDGNLDEIAYADAVSQDVTMAVRVICEQASNTIACLMAGSREFKLHGFRLNGVPCTNFDFHSEMTPEQVFKAEKEDADDPNKAKKAKKPRTRAEATTDQVAREHAIQMVDNVMSS